MLDSFVTWLIQIKQNIHIKLATMAFIRNINYLILMIILYHQVKSELESCRKECKVLEDQVTNSEKNLELQMNCRFLIYLNHLVALLFSVESFNLLKLGQNYRFHMVKSFYIALSVLAY